jgi:hypothetical protein
VAGFHRVSGSLRTTQRVQLLDRTESASKSGQGRQWHKRSRRRGAPVVDNLKKRGVPVELMMFPDEGHGWRKTQNRIRSTVEVTRWFVKYLKQDGK